MSEAEDWAKMEAEGSGVTTEELDKAVAEYKAQDVIYKEADQNKKSEYKKLEEEKKKLMELLTKAGKSKYYVEDIGTVYFVNKYLVTTPKTIQEKTEFFDYLKQTFGETFLMDKLGVYSATLNKIYNDSFTAAKEAGDDVSLFKIPGLQPPQVHTSLNFRKETK